MNKDRIITIFNEAIKLVENGWTQGALARNGVNHSVPIIHKDACKFCLSGALHRASIDNKCLSDFDNARNIVLSKLKNKYNIYHIVFFNDLVTRSQEDVVNILKECLDELSSCELKRE